MEVRADPKDRTRLRKILDVLRLKSPELEPEGPRVSCQFRPLHAAHEVNSAALHLQGLLPVSAAAGRMAVL